MKAQIQIDPNPSDDLLKGLAVSEWPVWEKEVSEFPWYYDSSETCYFLDGDVEVIPEGAEPVRVGKGMLVVFPAGMSCRWKVISPVRKHYRFG